MKKCLFAVIFMTVAAIASAQIDPTVEVSGKYDIGLGEIIKPDIPVSFDDSIRKFNVSFDYSIFDRPYTDLYDFTPFDAVQIKPAETRRAPYLYLKAGTQYPIIPTGELYFQAGGKAGFYLGLHAKHDSFFGKTPAADLSPEYDNQSMKNSAGLNLKYAWKNGEFHLGADYHYDSFHFTSDGFDVFHKNNRTGVDMKLRSTKVEENAIYYDFDVNYTNLSNKRNVYEAVNSQKENYFGIKGLVGTTFDVHRVYVDMNMEYASLSAPKNYTLGVVEFTPIYQYDNKKNFFAKLGVKIGNRFGMARDDEEKADDNDLSAVSSIFPDVDARFRIVKDALWIHAVVTGGNDINSFYTLSSKNPYLVPGCDLHFGSKPLDATLSIESVIAGRASINLRGAYVINRDKAIFRPVAMDGGMYEIRAGYEDINCLTFGVEAIWQSKSITTGGNFFYNDWKHPGNMQEDGTSSPSVTFTELPEYTGQFYFRYNWRERITASVDFTYSSSISGSDYSVPSIYDLDLNLSYFINRYFAVFAKVGNILNLKNQYVPCHVEPGINFGGGICIKL